MQVAFYLAGEIPQVKESIPWVRCAAGNVLMSVLLNPPPTQSKHLKWCCMSCLELHESCSSDLQRLLWPCGVCWSKISQSCNSSGSVVAHNSFNSSWFFKTCHDAKAQRRTRLGRIPEIAIDLVFFGFLVVGSVALFFLSLSLLPLQPFKGDPISVWPVFMSAYLIIGTSLHLWRSVGLNWPFQLVAILLFKLDNVQLCKTQI